MKYKYKIGRLIHFRDQIGLIVEVEYERDQVKIKWLGDSAYFYGGTKQHSDWYLISGLKLCGAIIL